MPKKIDTALPEEKRERQTLTRQLEGDLPYDRALYINEVRYLMKHTAETIIEIGKRLLIIQEHEGYGNFGSLVEEELNMSRRTAYRFMNCATKAEKFPRIDLRQIGTSSKVYALLEAPEEELKKFEQLGLFAGKDMDELETMSVKELRALVKDLRDNKEKYVARELKKLIEEKKDLERERDMLRRKHPGDIGTWVTGMRPQLSHAWENFLIQWRDFVMNESSLLNDEAQDFMVEFYDRIFADLDSIDETRYRKTGNRYTRRKK
jgi:hypothetical protein